jgi:tRNA(adenine34) deaminase
VTSIELMREAIAVAQASLASNDVPVGALIVDPSGKVIATGTNEREAKSDPTAHAEIVAMRKAATNGWRLDNHTLVVTLEPCAMCAGAIAQARISKVIFGAWDEKAGAVGSVWDVLRDPRAIHRVEVESGVLQEECAALLSEIKNL